jgi:hypothetical protein
MTTNSHKLLRKLPNFQQSKFHILIKTIYRDTKKRDLASNNFLYDYFNMQKKVKPS